MSIAFRVTKRTPIVVKPTPPNAPGSHQRVNQRSPVYEHAHPINIGHVVVFASDFAAMRAFYTEKLGFSISDEYPGHGVFTRCQRVAIITTCSCSIGPAKPASIMSLSP